MSWPTVAFSDVLQDVTGGNEKTKQSDYAASGLFPIVDQGLSRIGGYTDNANSLCKTDTPVIIFGDHTKTLKYIDFPFCLGADGTKVLKAKAGADVKYIYYALHNIHIPEAGYSRHFKYLKAGKIPLPPLEEQKRIAGILDQADALCRLRRRALDRLNTLGQAIFNEMFGRPGGSSGKIIQLGDLASRVTKGESPKWQGHDYQDDGCLFVTSENVGWGTLFLKKKKFVPVEFHEKLSRSQLKDGDLLINLVGASIGRACLFSGWSKEANINQAVAVISLNDQTENLSTYILAFILSEVGQNYLLGSRVDGARANVSLKNIRELPLFLPTEHDLENYSDRTAQLDLQKTNLEASLKSSEALFSSLQHRAFRGEL